MRDKGTLWKTFKNAVLINHSILSGYIAPSIGNIYTTLPQYNQMIFTHVYFFLITILVEFIMEHKSTSTWTSGRVAKVDLMIFFIFLGFRYIALNMNTFGYFR